MIGTVLKIASGIFLVGLGIFASIAAAGYAGDELGSLYGGESEKGTRTAA